MKRMYVRTYRVLRGHEVAGYCRRDRNEDGRSRASANRAAKYDQLLHRLLASPLGSPEARELIAEMRRTPTC